MNWIFRELQKSGIGSNLNSIIKSGTATPVRIPIDPARYTTPDGDDGWLYERGPGEHRYFKYNDLSSGVQAYQRCPPVAAIINRKAQAFTNGKVFILNTKGKEAMGPEATKLRKLFARPNNIQSWKSFEAQMYIYMDIFGFDIILPIKPFGFTENIDATSLWNIPASWIDLRLTEERFLKTGAATLQEIVIRYNGDEITLKLKELIIVKGLTPSFASLTFPASRLNALEMPINNIIGALESRNVLINYRGALGILSADPGKGQFASIPLKPDEKLELQRDFKRYGLRKQQFQVIMTTAALKWQQMGYPTKELMLLEEVVESTKSLCDGLNYPPHLLGLIDPTFNNQKEAAKGLYENSIIPDAENIYEQLTNYFLGYELNLRIEKDFSHIAAMQVDRVSAATARYTLNQALEIEFRAGLITLNDWLVKLGEEPLPGDLGNVRYADTTNKNVPLAVTLGVGGVQAMMQVLTATGISPEARQATLEIVFGIPAGDAERMADPGEQTIDNGNQEGNDNTDPGAEGATNEGEEN